MATQDVAMDSGTIDRQHVWATVVAAVFRHAIAPAHVMSTDATGAWISSEPSQVKAPQSRAANRCNKGHFYMVEAEAVASLREDAYPGEATASS